MIRHRIKFRYEGDAANRAINMVSTDGGALLEVIRDGGALLEVSTDGGTLLEVSTDGRTTGGWTMYVRWTRAV